MAIGWNISLWVKNMEWQVFAKIFHCAPPLKLDYLKTILLMENSEKFVYHIVSHAQEGHQKNFSQIGIKTAILWAKIDFEL